MANIAAQIQDVPALKPLWLQHPKAHVLTGRIAIAIVFAVIPILELLLLLFEASCRWWVVMAASPTPSALFLGTLASTPSPCLRLAGSPAAFAVSGGGR